MPGAALLETPDQERLLVHVQVTNGCPGAGKEVKWADSRRGSPCGTTTDTFVSELRDLATSGCMAHKTLKEASSDGD